MRASKYRRVWIGRALAIAALAGALVGDDATAATGISFPATSVYRGRNYDPFDEAASQVAPSAAVSATPAAAFLALHSDYADSSGQPAGDDPFERLPPVESSTVTCVFQAADTTPPIEPAQAEPLPAPPGKYERENDEEAAGSTWSARPVCQLSTDIVLPGGLLPKNHWDDRPQQFVACEGSGETRCWPVKTYTWVASCLCHNPLYFEEINLERYGYGCGCYGPCCSNCLQSAVSACHFFGTLPALPWKMAVDCPGECDYSLGYYRPGSCPPWRYNCCTRCSGVGALAESGAAVGLIFLIP